MANSEGNSGSFGASEACDEAETALKLFLQGKFDEAETYVEENAQRKDKITGAVPIFTHCHAVILFAKAGITGTEEDRCLFGSRPLKDSMRLRRWLENMFPIKVGRKA
jgi:hypothetical protein